LLEKLEKFYQYKVAVLSMWVQGDQLYWAFIPLMLVFPA